MSADTPKTNMAFNCGGSDEESVTHLIICSEKLERENAELNQRLIERTEAQLAKNAELQRELNALRSWKEQQMAVEKDWNPQELAKMLGGTLGVSCRKIIQEKVPEIVAQIAFQEQQIKELHQEIGRAKHGDNGYATIAKERDSAHAQVSALRAWLRTIQDLNDDTGKCDCSICTGAREALSSPPPPVVPQGQYDELKADAEKLADALQKVLKSASPHPVEHPVMCAAWRGAQGSLTDFRAKRPQQEKEGA